jgi:NTE family protein
MARKTAFVLSGGGTFGAAQAGMLRALLEHGIVPDLVVGTSAGALNAAFIAGQPDLDGVDRLAELWRTAPRGEIFPLRPGALAAGMTGRSNHLIPNDGLARWIDDSLTYDRIEDAVIPLHAVATDLLTSEAVVLSRGPVVPALLASAALPGIYPPVEIDGRQLVDGGFAADIPLPQATALGGQDVWILPPADAGATEPPHSALGVLLRAMSGLLDRRLPIETTASTPDGTTVRVLPPVSSAGRSMFDFDDTGELIDRAYALATAALNES